ncbi:acyl-CoA thioesterase [Lutimaribacter marinistellae]|uniref:Acyl-CoA thioesterase n=1 Tax=Lutimaribacter marinistellae TaxID=1820329 RepID=A0ABV7TMJ3_9RHOB
MAVHTYRHQTSFGDCDPAGIVYYPNICKWLDATFHDWIRQHGGHSVLCEKIGSVGLGLMEVRVKFRSPIRDGDALDIVLARCDWSAKSLSVHYAVMNGERVCAEGIETRGVFVDRDGRMAAGDTNALRAILDNDR